MVLATCAVSKGDLPLTITWYFNGKRVNSGDIGINLVNMKRSSQLNIDSVSHENQGNYTCVVKNEAGTMNHTAELFVNGIFVKHLSLLDCVVLVVIIYFYLL